MAKKASDLYREKPWAHWLIYGDSGAGKTMFAARAPKPFILLTELKSISSIVVANPDALVRPIKTFRQLQTIWDAIKLGCPTTTEDGQPAFKFNGAEEEYVVQTIVLDSLTDIHSRLVEHETTEKGTDWKRVQATLKAFLHDLGTLPVNVIALCLPVEEMDDQQQKKIYPYLYGKMAAAAPASFAGVGYMTKRKGEKGRTEHIIAFDLPGRYITKMPPSVHEFPRVVSVDVRTPGKTTLGSIQLYCHPELAVAHAEGDSASWLEELDDD